MEPENTHSDSEAIWERLPFLLVASAVIGAVIAGAIVWFIAQPDQPGAESPEAGFARDMSEHHAQAVQMALFITDKTQNDDIRTVATDILLTQQSQIGIMRGWLDVWDAPLNSDQSPMAWADMNDHDMGAMDGPMVGMATAEQLEAFRAMSGSQADREFLTLMIEHHKGGVMMAQAALDASDNADVERLASSIVAGQQIEIDLLEYLLTTIP